MRAAAFLPHPNILQAERDAREEALPDTRAQKYSTIEMVNQLKVVTPITFDDSFTMVGVVNISTESRVLGSIVTRMNRNQKKSLKKLADQVGMSAGEKVAIAKVLLQRHVKAGIL
jgi:hypothetical protein